MCSWWEKKVNSGGVNEWGKLSSLSLRPNEIGVMDWKLGEWEYFQNGIIKFSEVKEIPVAIRPGSIKRMCCENRKGITELWDYLIEKAMTNIAVAFGAGGNLWPRCHGYQGIC